MKYYYVHEICTERLAEFYPEQTPMPSLEMCS